MTSFQLASSDAQKTQRTAYDFPLRFMTLLASTWLGFSILETQAGRAVLLPVALFAIGSTLLSMCFLHGMEYFSKLRIVPRQSDLFVIGTALPLAGILTDALLFLFFRKFPVPLRSVLIYSPMVAIAIFGAHYLWVWRKLKNGSKIRIVLELLPQERESLVAEFQASGLDRHVEFLPPASLRASFLSQSEREIDQIVISRGAVRRFNDAEHLLRAHLNGIPIVDRRELIASLSGRINLADSDCWSYIQSATQQTPLLLGYAHFKVIIEPLLAFVLSVVLFPIMVVAAIAVRWTSPGPVFYRQLRSGYLGRPFYMVKFRSMTVNSEANGPQWAKEGDTRITSVGKILRATRIDELPQLWNVLRGEMSFFGPRPERPEFYHALQAEVPLFSMRTIIRPGITGWAQVCAGYAASAEESKTKLEFDLYYIKHVSLRLDMIVLFRTLSVALMGSERAKTQPSVAVGRTGPDAA